MVKDICLDSPLAAAQSLFPEGLEDYQSPQCLNNNDWKQAIHRINKTAHQTVLTF
jgi:hypothetical protein